MTKTTPETHFPCSRYVSGFGLGGSQEVVRTERCL